MKRSASRARTSDSGRILIDAVPVDLAQRHDLDQRQVHAAAMRPFEQGLDLVLVDALERHRVDLDLEAGLLRGVDARCSTLSDRPSG